jgi:glycosyltransferase involved in cell wall biosynthesis
LKPNIISIISPVYGASTTLKILVEEIIVSVSSITTNFEILLVDDNCPQNSWEIIQDLCKSENRIKGIKLSKNFGQHYAISAGLKEATGEWIVVMDCDLQDNPSEIPNLYKKATEGFDIVLGQRINREDSFVKKTQSKLFYSILSYLTGQELDNTIGNYGIYHSKVIGVINNFEEQNRFFPTMVNWVGFKKTAIEINHSKRKEGRSSYSLKKLLNLALDIILMSSEKPIRLIIKFGLLISFSSFIFIIYKIILYLGGNIKVEGYTSIITSICFFSGLIISFLGIIGLYVSKIFEGVKKRPVYIIDKKINF